MGSLHAAVAGTGPIVGLRTRTMEVDFNPRFIPAASVKPALSGLKWIIATQPRVVLRTNPGLSKNVPSGH
ncbi:MAG: hypothetical protein ACK5EA_12800, partial [Planctomycetaceae bacterium]